MRQNLSSANLQSLHSQCESKEKMQQSAEKARKEFSACRENWQTIENIISGNNNNNNNNANNEKILGSEKYHDQWRWVLQQLIFLASLCYFIETSSLLDINECQAFVQTKLPIDIEDYLHGISSLPNELCRLAVNVVRCNNSDYVNILASFVSDLYAGFRLLNLRNDSLRRKVDSMKYQCLKLEEVLYDMAVKKPLANNTNNNEQKDSTNSAMTDNSDSSHSALSFHK